MKHYILKSDPITPSSLPDDFDAELNDSQKEAVYFDEGPILVIAGAGSGKTKTLVYRVARLVHQGVPPEAILLLTFTRKAAQEMLKRASTILDDRCKNVSGGTFHAFSTYIMRQYGEELGYSNNFTVMDRSDQEDMVSMIRKDFVAKGDKRYPKKSAIVNIISKCVNTQKTMQEVLVEDYPQFSEYVDDLEKIRSAYDTQKQLMQMMDYDDLLVKLLQLLERSPRVRELLQQKYRYIMVDEYQDTNHIQSEIVLHLAGEKPNLMVVGDDAQSIYSFRGANVHNMLDFPNQFPATKEIRLEQNYRSNQPILDLTNVVIAGAKQAFPKRLFSEIKSDKKPAYVDVDSESSQSQFVCQKILELREEGVPLDKMVVLIRSGWHSNELEVMLTGKNIPFVKVGGFKFVETAHIKDVVSVLRVMHNPADQVSWNRFLLLLDGVGPKASSTIIDTLTANAPDPRPAVQAKIKGKAYEKDVMDLLNVVLDRKPDQDVQADLEDVLTFYKPIFKLTYDDFTKRESDLNSLKNIAENYKTLEEFLTELSLDPPKSTDDVIAGDKEDEKLTISTIHSAKGLEWHTVFLISCVDGYLPSFQSLNDENQLEEERRLMYVALTRAKENLFIIKPNLTYSAQAQGRYSGMQFSRVSRFLEEADAIKTYAEQWVIVDERKRGFSAYDDGGFSGNYGGQTSSYGGGYRSGGGYQSGRNSYGGGYGNRYGGGPKKSSPPKRQPGSSSNLPSYLRGSSNDAFSSSDGWDVDQSSGESDRGYRF